MKPVKCTNCKKFFDADKYERCPHCNQGEVLSAMPPMDKVATPSVNYTPPTPVLPPQAKPENGGAANNFARNIPPVVVQCVACKKYYDSSRDEICPHCKGMPAAPAKEEAKAEAEAPVKNEIKEEKTDVFSNSKDEAAAAEKKAEAVAEEKAEAVAEKKDEVTVDQRMEYAVKETKAEKIPEVVAKTEFVKPVSISEAVKNADSVQSNDALERYADSKTVAFYDLSNDVEPVVGWLVGLKGEYKGMSFNLKSGRNYVGRSLNMDVALAKENTVSRERHTVVSFDPKQKKFYIQSGESRGLTYVNGELLMSFRELNMYDVISLGACDLMFIPLCTERFSWENVR